jgi:hypothetical protein
LAKGKDFRKYQERILIDGFYVVAVLLIKPKQQLGKKIKTGLFIN